MVVVSNELCVMIMIDGYEVDVIEFGIDFDYFVVLLEEFRVEVIV